MDFLFITSYFKEQTDPVVPLSRLHCLLSFESAALVLSMFSTVNFSLHYISLKWMLHKRRTLLPFNSEGMTPSPDAYRWCFRVDETVSVNLAVLLWMFMCFSCWSPTEEWVMRHQRWASKSWTLTIPLCTGCLWCLSLSAALRVLCCERLPGKPNCACAIILFSGSKTK